MRFLVDLLNRDDESDNDDERDEKDETSRGSRRKRPKNKKTKKRPDGDTKGQRGHGRGQGQGRRRWTTAAPEDRNNINHGPKVQRPLGRLDVEAGRIMSIQLPNDTFTDHEAIIHSILSRRPAATFSVLYVPQIPPESHNCQYRGNGPSPEFLHNFGLANVV